MPHLHPLPRSKSLLHSMKGREKGENQLQKAVFSPWGYKKAPSACTGRGR
ncbi:hypothetical protein HMPREF0262_00720 [Clostridium sp. ATCC 29733]|nr:hypothetical protein HMPREF0262_00720 [Clostridium sp. ATCC 29733]